MNYEFERVPYSALNSRQKESYNFQKISGVLADFGFTTIRLSDDWNGADFIAQHLSGVTILVQLKGRFCVYAKYRGKRLWVAFPEGQDWYLFPHDSVLAQVLDRTGIESTDSWNMHGAYSWGTIPAAMRDVMAEFRLPREEDARG